MNGFSRVLVTFSAFCILYKKKSSNFVVEMMKKVIVAIDSFKGCLTSAEANQAACEGRCLKHRWCRYL